jgi:hypothetical protein
MAVMTKAKQKSILVLASLMLIYGVAVTWSGHAVWKDGVQEIFGAQVCAVGVLSIIFSLALFLSYFRKRKS